MKWKMIRSCRPNISPIATRKEFFAKLMEFPNVESRLNRIDLDVEGCEYGLWHLLLDLLHEAIERSDWDRLTKIVRIYAGVHRVGQRSEMFEAMYVAFEEDIKLPKDREKLRHFWRPFPRELADYLKVQVFFGSGKQS